MCACRRVFLEDVGYLIGLNIWTGCRLGLIGINVKCSDFPNNNGFISNTLRCAQRQALHAGSQRPTATIRAGPFDAKGSLLKLISSGQRESAA